MATWWNDLVKWTKDSFGQELAKNALEKPIESIGKAVGDMMTEKISQLKTKPFFLGFADEASMEETIGKQLKKFFMGPDSPFTETEAKAMIIGYCNWRNALIAAGDWRAMDLHKAITKLVSEDQQADALFPFLTFDDPGRNALLLQMFPEKPVSRRLFGFAGDTTDYALEQVKKIALKTKNFMANDGVTLAKLGVDEFLNTTVPYVIKKSEELNRKARSIDRKDRLKRRLPPR